MTAINAFFCHTPFTAYLAGVVAKSYPEPSVLFAEGAALRQLDRTPWSAVVELVPGRVRRSIVDKRIARKNSAAIRNTLASAPSLRLFFCSAQNLNQNMAINDPTLTPRAELHVLFDGFGTLLPYMVHAPQYARMRARWLFGKLGIGGPFSPFRGHIMHGHLRGVTRVHALGAEFLDCADDLKAEIPVTRRSLRQSPGAKNVCLFVDQPLDFLPPPVAGKLLATALHRLVMLGFDRILYKGHHFQVGGRDDSAWPKNVANIEEPRCVELALPDLNVAAVASFFSTSLFTTKLFFGDSLRSISFLNLLEQERWDDGYNRPDAAVRTKIRRIFEHYGVELPPARLD